MNNVSLNFDCGSLESIIGKLSFKFIVGSERGTYVQIYANDPTDGRKSGVLVTLDYHKYMELKHIISNIDETIGKLRQTNQLPELGF